MSLDLELLAGTAEAIQVVFHVPTLLELGMYDTTVSVS